MKTMKTLILAFVLLVTATSLNAQSKSDKLYDTFQNKPGVTYFAINKSMESAFNISLDNIEKTVDGDLQEIRFMTYNPQKGQLGVKEFCRKSSNLLPAACELVETDNGDHARIWMYGNKRKATEFHVLVSGDESTDLCFWISFYGDFKLNDLDGIKELGLEMTSRK